MAKRFKTAQAIADQVSSNRSAVGHAQHFAGHRERLTQEIVSRAGAGNAGRLCLLGAGNAYDVDLPALAACFAEVHLVDVDRASVEGARAAAAPDVAQRLALHAPVDVSGVFDELESWAANPPAPAQHAAIVDAAIARVTGALPGPFDVVVSCCLLTQIQLALLQVIGDRNPRFAELRALIGRIHMRVLARLAAPQGRALLVTDLTSNDTYPFETLAGDPIGVAPPDGAPAQRRQRDPLGASGIALGGDSAQRRVERRLRGEHADRALAVAQWPGQDVPGLCDGDQTAVGPRPGPRLGNC